ncbi:MAG: hypothetical protein A3K09_05280 [Nitrospinae bacterium RIFCSPLOWO2_12_FULL_47_7]|nr:MAG: hypothetical protein A3K09_05280 [Nitrospinae bacterium RIFCSPLOWO2_12_FULL_47_7]
MMVLRWLLLAGFLFSCSRNTVEQIEVVVPKDVAVPPDMAYIPSGEFIMGSPENHHTEEGRRAYLIDKYEVTEGQFRVYAPAHPFFAGKEKWPATHVTFEEADQYCHQLSKRLPTEAEWEKAARGTDGRKWPWGVYLDHPNNGFSGFTPEDVDNRREWISPYGVYGMGYNVWEWVDDWYSDGSGEKKFKVVRGGLTQTHLTVQFTPTYFSNWMVPDAAYNFVGFRCARDAG